MALPDDVEQVIDAYEANVASGVIIPWQPGDTATGHDEWLEMFIESKLPVPYWGKPETGFDELRHREIHRISGHVPHGQRMGYLREHDDRTRRCSHGCAYHTAHRCHPQSRRRDM